MNENIPKWRHLEHGIPPDGWYFFGAGDSWSFLPIKRGVFEVLQKSGAVSRFFGPVPEDDDAASSGQQEASVYTDTGMPVEVLSKDAEKGTATILFEDGSYRKTFPLKKLRSTRPVV